MESKHFSHEHGLVFHQTVAGSEIHCSGCKSPASGNMYACWKCNYFLHEQCFRATRSINHPSHPQHPLTLVSYPTYPSTSYFCNSCNLIGNGFSYGCSECEFDIHVHCAHMTNATPNLSRPTSIAIQNDGLNPIYPPNPSYNHYPPHSATNPNFYPNY